MYLVCYNPHKRVHRKIEIWHDFFSYSKCLFHPKFHSSWVGVFRYLEFYHMANPVIMRKCPPPHHPLPDLLLYVFLSHFPKGPSPHVWLPTVNCQPFLSIRFHCQMANGPSSPKTGEGEEVFSPKCLLKVGNQKIKLRPFTQRRLTLFLPNMSPVSY